MKSSSVQISRLRVGNEDFLVSSLVERCPKSVMLRELVKPALEAAYCALDRDRRVEIMPQIVMVPGSCASGTSGRAWMRTSFTACATSAPPSAKQNALDQNFGMGAKVANLPSNPHGIRYRSCKGGRVHRVVMGKRNDAYGRLHQTRRNGVITDGLEVTKRVVADGRGQDIAWTEVVLLGSRVEQDTVADPYDGNPGMPPGPIAEALFHRFHTLPPDISVLLRDGVNTIGGDQPFRPIGARTGDFARHEAVPIERGITLHDLYDAPDPDGGGSLLSARGALRSARSSAALVYRDEIYDFRPDWAWLHEAPVYGISFVTGNISIYVQVPDDFALLPEGYRQFRWQHNDPQHQIHVWEFAHLALRHRPAWLQDLLRQFAPGSRHFDCLQGEMAGLFRGVRRRWWPPGDGSSAPKGDGDGIEYEVAPQIVLLRDEADIRERDLEIKAERFCPETPQVFFNTSYSGLGAFRGLLEQAFGAVEGQAKPVNTLNGIATGSHRRWGICWRGGWWR